MFRQVLCQIVPMGNIPSRYWFVADCCIRLTSTELFSLTQLDLSFVDATRSKPMRTPMME